MRIRVGDDGSERSIDRAHSSRLRRRWSGRAIAVAFAGLTSVVVIAPAALAGDGKADSAAAEQHFFAGQKLYGQHQYHDALAEFRASYEMVKSPNSHLYVARALRELGQPGAAYDEYSLVIREAADKGPKYASTKKAAMDEQEALKDKIATVKLTIPDDVKISSVRVGNRNVAPERAGEPIAVEAGSVVVRVDAADHKPFEWRKEMKAGDTETVVVGFAGGGSANASANDTPDFADENKKADDKGSQPIFGGLRPLALVSAGVGVAGFVVWGVFGLKASSRFDDLQTRCAGRCGPAEQDSVDAGRRETTASTIGLVVGLVGVSAGVALWFLGAPAKAKATTQGTALDVRISPSPRAPAIAVGGAF